MLMTIIGDMNNWVVGFIDWNCLLDMLGGPNHKDLDECEGAGSDSVVMVNYNVNQFIYPQILFYYVRNIR